jgi:hypothetical protein
MVPQALTPKCHKMYITVGKQFEAKRGSRSAQSATISSAAVAAASALFSSSASAGTTKAAAARSGSCLNCIAVMFEYLIHNVFNNETEHSESINC